MRRLFALVVVALCLSPHGARAVPVPVGRLGITLHAGTDPRDPMPTERSDAARTGRLRGRLPEAEPRVLFDVALEGAHPRGPIIDREGRIFVGTAHGLVGLSETGEVLLDLRMGPVDIAPTLLPSGDLLVALRDLSLSIVRPSGDVVARTTLPAAVRAAPLVLDDGSVFLAAVDRHVLHLGSDLFVRATLLFDEGPLTAPTLLASGRVAVGGGSTLYVIDPARGTIVRRIALGGRAIGAAVRGAAGELYQLLSDAVVVRIDDEAVVGTRFSLHGEGETGRAFDANTIALARDGSLRVTLPSRGIMALAPDEAGAFSVRSSYTTDAPFYGPVSVDDAGGAIAVDRRGRMTVIDDAGRLRFRVELGVPIAHFAISGHALVVATDRPSIMAFELP